MTDPSTTENALTDREQNVLDGIAQGLSFSAIGEPLGITRQRVGQVAQILAKKGAVERVDGAYKVTAHAEAPKVPAEPSEAAESTVPGPTDGTGAAWYLQEPAVVIPIRDVEAVGPSHAQNVVLLDAAANTGSRYLVLVTPCDPRDTGGDAVVSVLQPWQAAYPTSGTVDEGYVRSRWSGGKERADSDIVAVTRTINEAIALSVKIVHAYEPPDAALLAAEGSLTWEFSAPPTGAQVRALLATLPPLRGEVPYVDFADYVQALPREQKVWMANPSVENAFMDPLVTTFSLYMSVAGRVKMLEALCHAKGWRYALVPEAAADVPGYLSFGDRLVYRVGLEVVDEGGTLVARTTGTAWVPAQGGRDAAGSSPYEKVETSALGRALAAFGIGVFPGSGVASLEEIAAARTNRAHLQAEVPAEKDEPRSGAQTKAEVLSEAKGLVESLRLARGETDQQAEERVGKYLVRVGAPATVWNDETKVLDWTPATHGQVLLLVRSMRDALAEIASAKAEV